MARPPRPPRQAPQRLSSARRRDEREAPAEIDRRGHREGQGAPAEIILGLLVFELGSYAQHRLIHRIPWAFPFHAVHHNPRRLVLLKTTRNHALDIGTATFVSVAPLVILGASPSLILWVTLRAASYSAAELGQALGSALLHGSVAPSLGLL